ncbi:MAG: hypothetical protein IT477_10860 [Rhodanobacteraceae bacterium]|nr:hypothetical protein [Rhodanobacteraceae bacterium]
MKYTVSRATPVESVPGRDIEVFDSGLDEDDVLPAIRLSARKCAEAEVEYEVDDPVYHTERYARLQTAPDDPVAGVWLVRLSWEESRGFWRSWLGEVGVKREEDSA